MTAHDPAPSPARRAKKGRQKAAGAPQPGATPAQAPPTASGAPADAGTPETGNVVTLPTPRNGIGANEEIDLVIRWAGDAYARLIDREPRIGVDPATGDAALVYRVRWVRNEPGKATADDPHPEPKWQPLLMGDVALSAIGRTYDVDRTTGRIGTRRSDQVFTVETRRQDGTPVAVADVRQSDLLATNRTSEWAGPSGLGDLASRRTLGKLPDLVHALAANHDGAVTPLVRTTGPVLVGDRLVYVPAVGQAFDRYGPTDAVAADPGGKARDHLAEVTYRPERPSFDDPATLRGLHAWRDLVHAHRDRGVSGVLVGQAIGGQMAGHRIGSRIAHTRVMSNLVGPSQSGKTTFALAITSSQTRSLHSEVESPNSCLVVRGNTAGGMKPTGAVQYLHDNGGAVALMDDVGPKAAMDDRHRSEQHTKITAAVVNCVVEGGPLQGTFDHKTNRVDLADPTKSRLSVMGTAEVTPPVPSLVDDGIANRMVWLWWDPADRCDVKALGRLQSESETLARNDGLRACLQLMLESPLVLDAPYVRAFDAMTAAEVAPRQAKNYARALAGLGVLDRAYERFGVISDLLGECLPAAIEQARRMTTYGTEGGADELVIADPVEAFRMAARALALQDGRIYWDFGSGDDPAESAMSPDVDQLPPGTRPEDFGWRRAGELPEVRSMRAGRVIVKARNGRHRYRWRVEMRSQEWQALCALIAERGRREGWRVGTMAETRTALESAGVLVHSKVKGNMAYQVDAEWLTAVPEEEA